MRHEKTLQDLIIRERKITGHQTVCRYEPCQHCGVLIMGAHDCPILSGRELQRVRRFILFVSLEVEKRKARGEDKEKVRGNERNVQRFGLYRRSA